MNPDSTDTSSEIVALRNQAFNLLVALIMISGTLTYVLYRQASLSGKDDEALSQQVNQQVAILQATRPGLLIFVNQLGAYGMTHPDIRPLLAKYGIAVAPTQPVAPAAPK
jgi:hypothetical protein